MVTQNQVAGRFILGMSTKPSSQGQVLTLTANFPSLLTDGLARLSSLLLLLYIHLEAYTLRDLFINNLLSYLP